MLNTVIEVCTKDNGGTKDGKTQRFSVGQGKPQRMKMSSARKKRRKATLGKRNMIIGMDL